MELRLVSAKTAIGQKASLYLYGLNRLVGIAKIVVGEWFSRIEMSNGFAVTIAESRKVNPTTTMRLKSRRRKDD